MKQTLAHIRSLGYSGRQGHACLYDAMDDAAKLVEPRSYLEIGVFDGGTLFSVLQASPGMERVVLCDIFGRDFQQWQGGPKTPAPAHIHKLLDQRSYKGSVNILIGDSKALIPQLPRDQLFDLVLVDGDHSAETARADCLNVYPLVRSGGIMVVDDSGRGEIAPVCDELVKTYGLRHLFTLDDGADKSSVFEKP